MPLLKPRADLIAILEAAYAPEPKQEHWSAALFSALRGCVAGAREMGLIGLAHGPSFANPTVAFNLTSNPVWASAISDTWFTPIQADPTLVQPFFYPGPPVLTASKLERGLTPEAKALSRESRQGAADSLGLFAYPRPGLASVFWGMLDDVCSIGRQERWAMQRVAAHLDSALRLRLEPEHAVAAVLAPNGKLLDLGEVAAEPHRPALGGAVLSLERSRLRARRKDAAALDEWRALIDGAYSLIPREDRDGKRYYLLVRNGPSGRQHAKLEAIEVDAVTLAARGYNGKGVAYALGITESRVSTHLGSAAHKLGLRSRIALVQVAASLFGARASVHDVSKLTASEREVLKLLRRGLSNAEIGAIRLSSRHTVANQVSSILRKTRISSRRVLVTRITD